MFRTNRYYRALPEPPARAVVDVRSQASGGRELEALSLGELFQPVRRRWITVVALTAFCAAIALLAGLSQKPVYEATALLEVEGFNDDFLNMKDLTLTTSDHLLQPYIQTQIRILESPEMMERVASRLNLEDRPEFQSHPLFGSHGATLSPKDEAIRRLGKRVTIREAGETHVIEVICESTDSQLASDLANTFSKEYIDLTVERRLKAANDMSQWLSTQLQDLKTNLAKSEQALQDYASNAGLVSLSDTDPNGAAEQNLRLTQEFYAKARDERIEEQIRYERATSTPADALPEVLDDPSLRAYVARLSELKQQAANLSATLKPAHYKVKEVQAQITELEAAIEKSRAAILKRIKSQYESALNRERLEAQANTAATGVVSQQAGKSVHYASLKREVETNRQLYESMLQKAKEAGMISAVRETNADVLSAAAVPELPSKPVLPLYGGIGGMIGLITGVLLAFARGNTTGRIRGAGDIHAQLGIPVLGTLPYAPGLAAPILTGDEAWNQLAEAARAAVATVLFSARDGRQPRVIAVTSAAPGEGKTTTAANLAIALAQTSQRVVLIDGNLRKPRLHTLFGRPNGDGFSRLLEELGMRTRRTPRECCDQTQISGLYLLTAGTGGEAMANRLYSPRLAALFHFLRQDFDAIVIDAPPLSELDSRPLARVADGVVMVIAARQTSPEVLSAGMDRLAADGTNILGTLVNHPEPRGGLARQLTVKTLPVPENSFETA